MRRSVSAAAAGLLAFVAVRASFASSSDSSSSGSSSSMLHPGLAELASKFEPELYAELGALGPASFDDALRTPCTTDKSGARKCVPGAFLIGNWQSNTKGLGTALAAHPDITGVGNDKCFGAWNEDKGGRKWLRQARPESLDPERQLLAALGCVTMLTFYPGFAGRFHKFWEREYWPCKGRCVNDKTCERRYFAPGGQMWPCKNAALEAHDKAVLLPASGNVPALNVTPPYLLRAFYGPRVKLVACVRSPIDRLRHAFYSHPHYQKRYGSGATGLQAYVEDQLAGWRSCESTHGAKRCAVHFEQIGPRENDVFFHADQLIRGIYAPFVHDWLKAFPEGQVCLPATCLLPACYRQMVRLPNRNGGLMPHVSPYQLRILRCVVPWVTSRAHHPSPCLTLSCIACVLQTRRKLTAQSTSRVHRKSSHGGRLFMAKRLPAAPRQDVPSLASMSLSCRLNGPYSSRSTEVVEALMGPFCFVHLQ